MTRTKAAVGGWMGMVAAAGLVALGAMLWIPSAAVAQNYVCPANLGPGERMVGMSPGGNGAPSIPLCTRDADAGSSESYEPQMRLHDSYLAAVWHDQSSGAWIAAGHRNRGSAERAARDACNRAMGGGCRAANWTGNGAIAIARNDVGDLWSMVGPDEDAAEVAVQRACREDGSVCKTINRVSSPPSSRLTAEIFAPQARRWGAAAWTESNTTNGRWSGTVWFSGGHLSRDQAEQAALAGCQNESGETCKAVKVASDVNLTVTVDEAGMIRINAAADHDQAVELARRRCREGGGADCQVKWVWGVVRNETVSMEVVTAPPL